MNSSKAGEFEVLEECLIFPPPFAALQGQVMQTCAYLASLVYPKMARQKPTWLGQPNRYGVLDEAGEGQFHQILLVGYAPRTRCRPGRGGGLPRKPCDVTTASLFEDSTTHIIIASSTLTVEGYQICSSLCTDQYASGCHKAKMPRALLRGKLRGSKWCEPSLSHPCSLAQEILRGTSGVTPGPEQNRILDILGTEGHDTSFLACPICYSTPMRPKASRPPSKFI